MQKITSVSNAKIKELTKLHLKKYRENSDLFLVEGLKSYQEISNSDIKIKELIVLEGFENKIHAGNIEVTIANDAVMKKLSTTDSIAQIITVAYKKKVNLIDYKNYKTIALFEDIKDPGNLGTIIRSAAAFRIEGIILAGSTIDLYNPKVIRSAAGNFFKVPIIQTNNVDELLTLLKEHTMLSTDLSTNKCIEICNLNKNQKHIIAFGSEAQGLSDQIKNLASNSIKIKMSDNVESLNLSVAASIVFYELYKKH